MKHNQTIDGVPRKILTAILCELDEFNNRALVVELRGLLDREVITDDHFRQRIAFLTSEVHARANERDAALSELADLKNNPPQGEPFVWPSASPEDAAKGWSLSYGFLECVTDIAASKTGYSTSMEATEAVLLAAASIYAAQPAPVAIPKE